MSFRHWSSTLTLCAVLTNAAFGQNSELEAANTYFKSYLFKDAIPMYERALEKDPKQGAAHLSLADCYRFTHRFEQSVQAYEQAFQLDPALRKAESLIAYVQTLRILGKTAQAQKVVDTWLEPADPRRAKQLREALAFSQRKDLKKLFKVENAQALNSKSSDFSPTFYKDQLLFASCRSVPVEKETGVEWTSDLVNQYYLVLRDPISDSVYSVKPLRPALHDRGINDAPMAYTADGHEVVVTTNNFMDGIRHTPGSGMMLDLYQYETRSMSEWNRDTERFFAYNAKSEAATPHSTGFPAFSPDGKTLYFASDRPGGFGGYDLYVCRRTATGWSSPENLGSSINTPGNELCPFVDAKGHFFFASDWLPGFGGMDVFMAEQYRFGWGEPFNLGPEVNSSYDDFYWIYDAKAKRGYFASNRPGGEGLEDLYRAQLVGEFPERKAEPVQAGEKIVLHNDIFDLNPGSITPTGDANWKRLLTLLSDNPNSLIQINVHSDARGLASANLSQTRNSARLLAAYLVEKGIASQRILYEGYGEEFPMNRCKPNVDCTEEEHQQNRRTEVYFVGTVEPDGAMVITHNASPGSNPSTTALAAVVEDPSTGKLDGPSSLTPDRNRTSNNDNNASATAARTNNSNNSETRNRPLPPDVSETKVPDARNEPPVAASRRVRQARYKVGDMVELAVVHYALEKAVVDERKSEGLDDLVDILKSNPYWVVEIASHTDATGSSKYNLNLSQKRAQAVKNYLSKRGIEGSRLVAKGYGETRVLNHCKDGVRCSEAEHAVNRRTEFRIIGMRGFNVGDLLDIQEIHYEFGKTNLDMRRNAGLQELVTILKNSSIRIEIGSHTDSKGRDDYNMELSEKRAKAIYDYLLKQGIGQSRLTYKGYGETQLINHCKEGVNCTEAQHKQNRRTVFKVTALK